jgi:hypothetical protein
MPDKCTTCGCIKAQVIADAKTLGLQQELESGTYTCCQIAEWAHEQWLAWITATEEDTKNAEKEIEPSPFREMEGVLVPVRFRRPVPWFRKA